MKSPTSTNAVDTARRCVTGWLLAAPVIGLIGCAGAPPRDDRAAVAPENPIQPNPSSNLPPSPSALDLAEREAVVAEAMLLVNTPYRYGGNTPEGGFDCSGLVCYVFAQADPKVARRLPRTTAQWAAATVPVDVVQRGDLVFFNIHARFSHMGIYVGNEQFVHAPSNGGVVRKASLQSRYFAAHYQGARRFFAA